MAAAQLTGLQDEATCSICLEYFTDPVTIDCGHNFCRSCITQSWGGRDGDSPCPQCRGISGRRLRPNRQLGNMVEMVQQLHLPPLKPPEEHLCEKHQEKLRLFCEEDQTLICVVCDRSKEHRPHAVTPIEEAAQEYKFCGLYMERGPGVQLMSVSVPGSQISYREPHVQQSTSLRRCRNGSDVPTVIFLEEICQSSLRRNGSDVTTVIYLEEICQSSVVLQQLRCNQSDLPGGDLAVFIVPQLLRCNHSDLPAEICQSSAVLQRVRCNHSDLPGRDLAVFSGTAEAQM
ncbi:hypothetical protein NDU88_000534 [Pleurodeles waltl]|uniref:RING-type E3 ubiquitin transferase n=1 Tax=Pleurodeles waltl TaxID=8319 RepID=A0AAV7U5G4_PLEWA|nr:hypothetical protein NDU88_000534 [Pleurodeles waltl]